MDQMRGNLEDQLEGREKDRPSKKRRRDVMPPIMLLVTGPVKEAANKDTCRTRRQSSR